MSHVASRVAENLARVRDRIAAAAGRAGRPPDDIRLVAVTKYVEAPIAAALVAAGCHDLGESRPQSLWNKAAQLGAATVRWHMIGHLQRNKIRRTLPLVHLVHSTDSRRLLAALEEEAALAESTVNVLLEVNVTPDITKTGFAANDLAPTIEWAASLAHVSIRGLMGMASLGGDEQAACRDFERIRRLRDELAKNCPPTVTLDELSMGMSNDFEIAIEEGATLVRVGSALFEGLEP